MACNPQLKRRLPCFQDGIAQPPALSFQAASHDAKNKRREHLFVHCRLRFMKSSATGPALTGLLNQASTPERQPMLTYIALSNFTDQGMRSVKDTLKRADAVKQAAQKFDARMTQLYWTQGKYDLVAFIEAPDELSATAFALAIGMAGNVRTQTMRAFTQEEMGEILGKLG